MSLEQDQRDLPLTEEYTPMGEEYTPMEQKVQSRAPEQAASELAGLALSMDEEDSDGPDSKYQQTKQELMQNGQALLLDKVVRDTAISQRAADASSLQSILASDEYTSDIKAQVLQSFGETQEIVPDVQGAQIERFGASNPEMNYDGIEAARADELRTYEMIDERLAEMADGFNLGDIVDFGGAMLPMNESKTVSAAIQAAFPEAGTWDEYSSYAWLGGAKEELVELYQSVPRAEWPDRTQTLIQALADNAGYFGGNEMIESMILMDLTDKLQGLVETEGTDVFEVVDNLTSIADATLVGGAALRGIKGSGRLIKGTNLSRLSKANPKKAAEVTAAGIIDPEVAKAAGTTQANLGVRAFVPKQKTDGTVEWIEDVPASMVDRMREQFGEGVARAIDEVENAKTTTQAERNAAKDAREAEIDAMNGVKFSTANTVVDFVGDKIRTTLKFVSAKGTHFTSAEEAMNAAKATFPLATQIGIEAVRIGTNTVTSVKNIYNEAEVIQRSLLDAVGDRLKVAKAGATKGGKGLSKEEAEALKRELKGIDDAIAQVENKAITKTEKKKQVTELTKARKIVESKLKATGKAKASSPEIKELEADLAKIKAGNYTDLKNPDLANMAAELAKPVKTEEMKDFLPKYGYVAKVETIQEPSEVSKLMFGTSGFLDEMPDILKPMATWLAPPASNFSRAMTRFADRAFDRTNVISRGLQEMAEPFLKLKRSEQVKVVEALARGDVEAKVFTDLELKANFNMDASGIAAYRAWRKLEDGLWAIKDHEMARTLRANGNKWIQINDKKWAAVPKTEDIVKSWLKDPRKPKKVYDAESGAVLSIDEALIKDIYSQGGFFAKSDSSIDIGKDRLTHIVVRRNHRVDNIPEAGVLNKLEGHVTRFYDVTYFITKTTNGMIDGTESAELIKVLNTAGTKKEAEALVAQLNAQGDGAIYKWRHDRSLSHQEKMDMQRSLDSTNGMFKHTARGEHKRNSAGTKADILNPVESLDRAIQAASRTVTVDRMIGEMKQRWINSYGHLTNGKFPSDSRQISNEGIANNPETGKAIASMRWIQHMEGQKSKFDNFWEQTWLSISEQFANPELARGILKTGTELNPVRFLRGAGFTLFIVFNPVRQLFLQTSQILFLSGLDPKYFASGKLVSDANALAMAHRVVRGAKEDSNAFKRLAKALNVSVDEAKDIAKAYDETGFYDSVDTHTFTRDGMGLIGRELGRGKAGEFAATMQYGWNRFKSGVRTVGFDAGERANLLMTWNIARRQYMAKNPAAKITDRAVQDAIATDARAMALSMTQSGELSYQKGLLSLATQFWSVQHKAFTAMLTDSTFTKQQKVQVAAGQLLLWGTSGFGLREAYHSIRDAMGIEPNEVVDDIIAGGLVEAAINNLIIDGEINVAGSLAPGGGLPSTLGGTLADALSGDRSTVEMFFGASYSAMGKVNDAASSIQLLLNRPDKNMIQKVLGSVEYTARMSSGANNFVKMMMALNMKAHVDSTGDPIVEATFDEILAKGIFGFQPEAVEEYYKILNAGGGKAPQEEVDKEAARVLNYFKNDLLTSIYPMSFDWSKDSIHERQDKMQSRLLEKFDDVIATSMALYDGDFGLAVQEAIRKKIVNEWRDPQTRAESLIEQLVTNARKGSSGDSIEDTRILIENSNLPANDKMQWLRLLEESFDNRERQLEGRGF